ncbi:M48 family metallopeptidase [Lutibacter sp.]|uniref:M48 family metallopeptidase n=1 Tax=Lutibacter sp. TaxID=1925666 RepID=UPI001A1CA19C|nr:SprT family zinc-dependent metalloprotease [Lutibacter sp.]MBI9041959.1 M48 family metallopeptidase [Lutibacter sp.]
MIVSGVDITIHKSKRKTLSIFIERNGSVSARVPETLTDEDILEVLKSKEYQIHKNLADWVQSNTSQVYREYVSGQSFLYLGRNYRLKLVDENLGEVIFKKGYFLLSKNDVSKAKELFIEFYKGKLKEKLPLLVKKYQEQLAVNPKEVKVMELQNRWASCTSKRNVNFHWKCAMAPINVLNYIVVHELAHLIHLNHTKEFWNEVDKILPNYDKQISWLKINGAGMDL